MAGVDDFKYVLTLWKKYELPELIERNVKPDLDADKVIVITGVRRAGKTHVMFQCIKTLLATGVRRDSVIYIDFENERLIGMKAADLDNLLVAHLQLFNPEGMVYIFLDEIQNVENWDKWVRKIYNTGKYRIILTGSSSKLLSREIAAALAGRNLTYAVYPFSFEEFLTAKKIKINKFQKYSAERGIIRKAMDEFLEYGSFPEIALTSDETRKMEILSSYFDAIFFKDILKGYSIREVRALSVFLKIISSNYASHFSSVKSYNYFGSIGMKISRITILNFLEYAKSVFLVVSLEQYLKSTGKRFARQSKSYIIDIGISRLFSDIDRGRALENAVFLELLRRRSPADNISYLKLSSNREVDFIYGGKTKELIQVSYDVSSAITGSRETRALVEAARKLDLKRGTIITYDFEEAETIEGIDIHYEPFWIWATHGSH